MFGFLKKKSKKEEITCPVCKKKCVVTPEDLNLSSDKAKLECGCCISQDDLKNIMRGKLTGGLK